jgi:hypothetical protein
VWPASNISRGEPQILINAVTGQVKSDQIHMSGNATYLELDGVPGWQLSRGLTLRLRLPMLQFVIARLCEWTIPQMPSFRRNRRELLRATLVTAGEITRSPLGTGRNTRSYRKNRQNSPTIDRTRRDLSRLARCLGNLRNKQRKLLRFQSSTLRPSRNFVPSCSDLGDFDFVNAFCLQES